MSAANSAAFVVGMHDGVRPLSVSPNAVLSNHCSLYCRHASQLKKHRASGYVSQPLSGTDDKKGKSSRLRFWNYNSHHQQGLPHLKMAKIAIFALVAALGFVVNRRLRTSYPQSVHEIVRVVAFWTGFTLVYLANNIDATQTISVDLGLALLSIVVGFVIDDTIALFGAGQTAPPHTKQQSAEEKTGEMHKDLADIIMGGKPNQHDGHQARAFPNRRLEVAFRVNNCFTAMKKKRCDDVREAVLELLQPPKSENAERWRDWPELVEVARTVTRAELSSSQDKVNLFSAMQMVIMKTMIKVLFNKSPTDTTKDSQIRKLARDVDRQWQDSKGVLALGEAPEWDFEQQGTLRATAEDIFGPWDDENEGNPFNMILPGYETMWRVVMRCFLELSSSRHPSATTEAWKE
jgi:hypothetical protein